MYFGDITVIYGHNPRITLSPQPERTLDRCSFSQSACRKFILSPENEAERPRDP